MTEQHTHTHGIAYNFYNEHVVYILEIRLKLKIVYRV